MNNKVKIINSILCIFVLCYACVDVYIYYSYQDERTKQIVYRTVRLYGYTPEDSIPDNIINAYERVFPNSLKNKIYPDILWYVLAPRHTNSYVQINLAYDVSFASRFQLISIANQLDNGLTKKQCIYAYLSRFDFLNNARGLKEASSLYYHKNVNSLSERECLELIIMTMNPSLYNKLRHQDKLDKAVNKILVLKAN